MPSLIPLQPVARPVDTFAMPDIQRQSGGTEALQLANALAGFSDKMATDVIPALTQEQRLSSVSDAEKTFNLNRDKLKNQADLKAAVASGLIPDGANPWKIDHLKTLVAQGQVQDQLNALFTDFRDNSGLYNSDDYGAAAAYIDKGLQRVSSSVLEGSSDVPHALLAVTPKIEQFRNDVLNNLISRRTSAIPEEFDRTLSSTASDLGVKAALGIDVSAPSKVQGLLDEAYRTTPGGKANAIVADAVIKGYETAGQNSGGPDAARAFLGSIKVGTTTLDKTPGVETLLTSFEKRYALDVAQNGSLANRVREQRIKNDAIPIYNQLRAKYAGVPLDQVMISLEDLRKTSPEVHDEVENLLIASKKQDEYVKKSATDDSNRNDATELFEQMSRGTPLVRLQPLIARLIHNGGTTDVRGAVESFRDMSSTTDPSTWASVLQLHTDGNWDSRTLQAYLPLIGRDKLDEAFKLADPLDPSNRRDGGRTIMGRVVPALIADLHARNDGRYAFSSVFGFAAGDPGSQPDGETINASRIAENNAMAVQLQERLRQWLLANPKATENDLVKVGGQIRDDIAKNLNLPTTEQVLQARQKKMDAERQAAAMVPQTPAKPLTGQEALTKSVDSVDPIMRQLTPDIRSRTDRMMSIPTAQDSQLPDLYQPDRQLGFFDKVKGGLSSWGEKISALGDLRIGGPLFPAQQRQTSQSSAPARVDPTQDFLDNVVRSLDPDRNPQLAGMVRGRDAALKRRDELKTYIQSSDVVGQLDKLTTAIEARAKLGSAAISYEDKTRIRSYQNAIAEYEVLTKYAGVPVSEAASMGPDAWQHVLVFGDDASVTPQAVQAAGKQLGLTTTDQLKAFVAAQTALLRHRDYAISRRG